MSSLEGHHLQRNYYYAQRLEFLINHITEQIPNFKIKKKKDSFLMRVVGTLLFFNKSFMDTFITTMYPCVYVPEQWDNWADNTKFEILAHEYVHLKDAKRFWLLFEFMYLMPQLLALCSIGMIWNIQFAWFLIFLLPIPSPSRAWLEYRGYRMQIGASYWLTGEMYNLEYIVEFFTGADYYFMFPMRKLILKKMISDLNQVMIYGKVAKELEEMQKIIYQ